jgi:hypothetical protein
MAAKPEDLDDKITTTANAIQVRITSLQPVHPARASYFLDVILIV